MGAEDDAWTPDVFLLPSKRKMSKIRNDGIEREREKEGPKRKKGERGRRQASEPIKNATIHLKSTSAPGPPLHSNCLFFTIHAEVHLHEYKSLFSMRSGV